MNFDSREFYNSKIKNLSEKDAEDFKSMIERQRNFSDISQSPKEMDLVIQAYIQVFSIKKGISCPGFIPDQKMKQKIFDLYTKGVLPVRIGGIDKELIEEK